MKLALCVFKYFPYGGLQRNFVTITQELQKRGHEITIYTCSWEGERVDGVSIEIIHAKGMTNYGKNRSFYTQVKEVIKRRSKNGDSVDLVVGFNKMPGLDVYYCADTCFATKAREQKGLLYRLTPRSKWSLAYEKAVFGKDQKTEILLLSANEGRAYQKYYFTDSSRLHLMPPGISKSRVRNDNSVAMGQSIREQLGILKNESVIAFLGSDYKRKGLDRLLKSVAALSDNEKNKTKILVIGRDKRLPEYQRLSRQLNIDKRVIFVGQRDDVPALLFASDYLAHPAYSENTGNVILEGVVAGLPVICTEICGYSFYIEDNQLGYVIPEPFEQSVMDKLLEQMLSNSDIEKSRCLEFSKTADIYSRPQRIAETIERIGEKQCQ